jgi:hypothetical protein
MSSPRAITLIAVAEKDVADAWRTRPLDELAAARPRGRLAALLAGEIDGMIVDGTRPGQLALAALGAPGRRRAWDALVEDLARAALHDAPAPALTDAFAALAKVAGRPELAAARLDGAADPAYPDELLEPPGASGPISIGGKVAWVRWAAGVDAHALAAAARQLLGLPAGAFPRASPELWRDLIEALAPLLKEAAEPGVSLLASRDA